MGKPSRTTTSNKKKSKGKKKPSPTTATTDVTPHPTDATTTARPSKGTTIIDFKSMGNSLFTAKKYADAVNAYTRGLQEVTDMEDTALRITLLNNRTMAYIKMEDKYIEAKADCDFLINELNVTDSSKVWYRRANALFQNSHSDGTLDVEARIVLLKEALADLDRSESLQLNGQPDTVSRNLRKKIDSLLHLSLHTSNNQNVPPFSDQRHDILHLLQSHAARGSIRPNEAFFLIDWNWWCTWCTATGLCGGGRNVEQYLPGRHTTAPTSRWAILPPLDNSSLMAPPSPEWCYDYYYHHYGGRRATMIEDAAKKKNGDTTTTTEQHPPAVRLKPGLYRGFHYEILPREVYHALTVWYTETTPPLVVRTNAEAKVVLYPTAAVRSSLLSSTALCWCGACGTPVTSKKRCQACQNAFYCDRSCQERHWKTSHRQDCGSGVAPVERRRAGLHNLGNTCFMNAAVTALFHATPITRPFLRGTLQVYRDNPLGSGGRLAQAFTQTVDLLWQAKSSVNPGALKRAVAVAQPRFAGYAQHDAQEFLSFLLDGLHEDLNAASTDANRTYCDDPPDGVTAWHSQCQRNASVLWDHVYGQFVSTCVCPVCDYTSVSFDAYNHVSLELPPRVLVRPVSVVVVRPGQLVAHVRVVQEHLTTLSTSADLCQALRKQHVLDAKEAVTVCEVERGAIVAAVGEQRRIAEYYGGPRCTSSSPLYVYPGIDMNRVAASSSKSASLPSVVLLIVHHLHRDGGEFGVPMLLFLEKDAAVLGDIHGIIRKSLNHDADWSAVAAIRWVNREGSPMNAFEVAARDENGNEEGEARVAYTNIVPNSEDALESYVQNKTMFLNVEWSISEKESADIEWVKEHPSSREPTANLDRVPTLQQCLATFTRPERLDANNMWYCSRCKDHVQALKTMGLWKLPNILILHLKRFKHSLRREKLDVLVDFPLEGLEVPQCVDDVEDDFVQSHEAPAVYDCFAVVNHYGRMGGGHYTSMCRRWNETSIEDQWWLFDDSTTRPVDQVVSPAAYVLFYRRRVFQ